MLLDLINKNEFYSEIASNFHRKPQANKHIELILKLVSTKAKKKRNLSQYWL